MKSEHEKMIRDVQEVFPMAMCTGYNAKDGFCIYWPTELCPVVATGRSPAKAWKNAYKLVRGKNKKALERLRRTVLGRDVKKGQYGPGC